MIFGHSLKRGYGCFYLAKYQLRATSSAVITVKMKANKITPILECSPSLISGISSYTTTYIITPAVKPVSAFCTVLLSPFFINSTQAAPKEVPKKGIKIPFIASYNIIILS